MFFFNLSAVEFVALLSAASALVVALYLLSRTRRRQVVATLRFWSQAVRPEATQQRRKIQQPLSLLLQLIALALLLLAIAQPRVGTAGGGARDHVLVLDTSSWMAAGPRERTLMDEARERARAYIDRVPASDRIMLVRADGLSVPATTMTDNRETLLKAVSQSRPAASALDISQALAFAGEARKMNSRNPGEVVFVGAARINQRDTASSLPANLRIIPVRHEFQNCGLRRIGLRHSATDPDLWDVFVSARNYGSKPMTVPLVVQFGGAPVAAQRLQLVPGRDQEFSFHLRTSAAGWLEARLLTRDSLSDDDRAVIEIPRQSTVRVAVYTADKEALRPLIAAHPHIQATFHSPSEPVGKYSEADVTVLDGFEPATMPSTGIIWLRPPNARAHVTDAAIVRWRTDHELCAGLHATGVRLDSADVLTSKDGDVPIAEVEGGPVILCRTRPQRMVLLGFHPGRSDSRFDVMTPLLFANVLRWLKPDAFRAWEVDARTVGNVTVQLDSDETASDLRVVNEHGDPLPFNVRGNALRFYSGSPGAVRVTGGRGERVYSLTLPEVGDSEWAIPSATAQGLPPRWSRPLARDFWQWLAAAGGIILVIEWLLYGRARRGALRASQPPARAFMKRAS